MSKRMRSADIVIHREYALAPDYCTRALALLLDGKKAALPSTANTNNPQQSSRLGGFLNANRFSE